MHRAVTTLLDLLGLLLVAAGAYYLVVPVMGHAGLMVAGAVVLAGSQLAARAAEPQPIAAPAWLMRLGRWIRQRVVALWRGRAGEAA